MPIHVCADCGGRVFGSTAAFTSHCKSTGHGEYCEPCQRWFVSMQALQMHLRDSPKHQVDSDSDTDYDESSESSDDDTEPFCQGCNRWFVNIPSLYAHLRESSLHNWCFICSRDFSTPSRLLQHENSLAHKSRDMKCPFCAENFKSPSGVALHIESGCHKIHRHQVTAAVHALRIVPTISVSHRLSGPSAIVPATVTTLIATEASFNGTAYVCSLPNCRRKFSTLPGLNAHLNSPAHDQDEFKCPKCKRKYKLISGLVQHIESAACNAAAMKKVEEYYDDLTAAFTRSLRL